MRVWLVLAALALAGCSTGSDTPDGTTTGTTTDRTDTNVTVTTGTTTTNGTGNATETWTYDNRTGSVSGVALVDQPEAQEDFQVANGTVALAINVTTEGGELDLVLHPPGCEDDACATTAATQGGQASLSLTDPDEGAWRLRLVATGLGPVDVAYEASIGTA